MTCLCLGGVCIPYTALFPMLIIGLQWIAYQFAKVGLLPEFIAKRLGLVNGKDVGVEMKTMKTPNKGDDNCCGGVCGSAVSVENDEYNIKSVTVDHITDNTRWEALVSSSTTLSTSRLLIVKFTADWCNPCKAIQPAYMKLATKYQKVGTFITLDIDGEGCDTISSRYKVAILPTFICFSKCGGDGEMIEMGRMTGGKDEDYLAKWMEEMVSKM